MKLLVLGGTIFVGRHIVREALERGHEVTLLHRGQRGADLFPEVERVLADRDGGLDALGDRQWDAVIDTSGYVPRIVRQSAQLLKDRVRLYMFVSTISVYRGEGDSLNEESPLLELDDPSVEEVTGETYGGLKVLCERAVTESFPARHLIVRPGLIVGPNDSTDRFTYWPVRFARGGRVLAMNRPEQPVQFIDVRDLASWIVGMVERGETGVYNATGPQEAFTMGEMLEGCRRVVNPPAEIVWADEEWLQMQNVEPWGSLPFSIPSTGSDTLMRVDVSRAQARGLVYRPFEETVRDTLSWWQSRENPLPAKTGLTPEREAELLEALEARFS